MTANRKLAEAMLARMKRDGGNFSVLDENMVEQFIALWDALDAWVRWQTDEGVTCTRREAIELTKAAGIEWPEEGQS